MKKLLVISLLLGLIFSLCGCSLLYTHVNNAVGSFDVGCSEKLGKAFLAGYNWDGTEEAMNIVLPESYNGVKITGLGGYTGRGVPAPFRIEPNEKAREILCPNATDWMYAHGRITIEIANVQYLRFKLHISKQIAEIENLSAGGFIIAEYQENGETKEIVYILTCYVTCDEGNNTFYSKDGKLYNRQDNSLVEDIVYEDFDLEEYIEQTKEERGSYELLAGHYSKPHSSAQQGELDDCDLAKIVAENLDVPDNVDITYQVSETFYWEAAERYFKNVTIIENGEAVAFASVDPYTGELLRNILKYDNQKH